MPNALSTFIVEYEVINKTVKPHVSITMDYAANAPCSDTTVGKGEVKVSAVDCDGQPVTMFNGLTDIVLTDQLCLAKSTSGSFAYYSVVGGLPKGEYIFTFHFVTKTAGVYVLSVKGSVKVTVTDQGEVLQEECDC
jgi:hypothetical protein